MRWTAFCLLVACGLLLVGCDSGGSPPVASNTGATPPPPPGGAPGGPPPPGDAAPPPPAAAPAESPPPQQPGSEGLAPPQSNDAPPPEPTPPPVPQESPPGDAANPAGVEPGGENPDGTPRRPPPPPRPRTLREQAIGAFRQGNDQEGFQKLNTYYAVMPKAQQELAEKMGWVPALVRPALVPRIGIAVQFIDPPRDFKGNPMPVGSKEVTAFVDSLQQKEASDQRIGGNARVSRFARGNRRPVSNMTEGADKAGDRINNAPAPFQIVYYTGEFGEMMVDALQERIETGEYGRVFQELAKEVGQTARRGGRGRGGPGGDEPGEGDAGQPGYDGAGDSAGGSGVARDSTRRKWATRGQEKDYSKQIQQLRPAVLWLGKEESREEIMKVADAANIDVMLIFEVTLKEARTGNFTNNRTVLKMLATKTGKPIPNFSPEPLVNLTVEQWRQKNEKGEDPVEHEVVKAIEALDKVLKPMPLPEALTAERAKKRIADLVAEQPEDPLPVIVEARFYVAKGLLPEEEARNAAVALLGESGYSRLLAMAKEK